MWGGLSTGVGDIFNVASVPLTAGSSVAQEGNKDPGTLCFVSTRAGTERLSLPFFIIFHIMKNLLCTPNPWEKPPRDVQNMYC